jgi:hypothetical protein
MEDKVKLAIFDLNLLLFSTIFSLSDRTDRFTIFPRHSHQKKGFRVRAIAEKWLSLKFKK